jgi:hypothetical protein
MAAEIKENDIPVVGIGLVFFILALIYSFSDYNLTFDKTNYIGEWKSAFKYATTFVLAYIVILFKALIVLFFIYVLFIVYNIAIIGAFRPLVSNSIDSNDVIDSSSSAREIIQEARQSYFGSIKKANSSMFQVAFGFIHVPYAILLVYVLIPILLYVFIMTYYFTISSKKKVQGNEGEMQNILVTNYHFFMIFLFVLIIIALVFLILSFITAS